jgi:uncharacterized protein YjlB
MEKIDGLDEKSAQVFISEFLKQPAGKFLIRRIEQYRDDQHAERIEVLERLQHKTDFTEENTDAVVQRAHYEAAAEEILDILNGYGNLEV